VPSERVEAVLREVGLGAWLRELSDGVATPIGGSGAGMSAGEAQLLALARLFLADPDVVVLDEPSSRLDPVTEERVEQATTRLMHGRTCIVIAHRLAALAHVDAVAVLEDGRVVEPGTRVALEADPESRLRQLLAPEVAS
jgi:ATP-binding cassette subfamily B protein